MLRDCLAQYACGVTVVTVRSRHGEHGATVSSFTSISLSPALVMVSVGRLRKISTKLSGQPFGINILAGDQQDVALQFAGLLPDLPRAVEWHPSAAGSPRICGVSAFLECMPWAEYDGGDHVIHVGMVSNFEFDATRSPLVSHGGRLVDLAPAPPM